MKEKIPVNFIKLNNSYIFVMQDKDLEVLKTIADLTGVDGDGAVPNNTRFSLEELVEIIKKGG